MNNEQQREQINIPTADHSGVTYNDEKQIQQLRKTLWMDETHGFTAQAISKTMAWMLIRNKCHELNLPVPTMNKIKEVKLASNE